MGAHAWTCLFCKREIENGQMLVMRGATSSFRPGGAEDGRQRASANLAKV
jgi:hypothetical protein